MPDKAEKCQAQRLGLANRPCPYAPSETLGDTRAIGPEEADRIRKKVGMKQ